VGRSLGAAQPCFFRAPRNAFNAPATIPPMVRPLLLAYFRSPSTMLGGSFNVIGTVGSGTSTGRSAGMLPPGTDMLDDLTDRTRVTNAVLLGVKQHDAGEGPERRSAAEPFPPWSNAPYVIYILPLKTEVKHRVPCSPARDCPFELEITFCVSGVISPVLSNLYLNEVDRMLERAKESTRCGKYTFIEYARFADDLVVLIDAHPRHDWLMKAVEKRLREEIAKLQVQINEEKSRVVDLERGESFGFLGFDFRRVRSLKGAWRPQYTPKLKKRTALLRTIKEVFRQYRSQPVTRVIELINPVLRGWVNYFAVGHSGRCFHYIKDWVAKKVRRHVMQARKRQGYGWGRWSRQWLYETLGLFKEYRVQYFVPRATRAVPVP
jgi:RNA-directed DNA polymerase